jgi:hypothetical protein
LKIKVFAALLAAATLLNAESLRSVDVLAFDIAGVKLGMTFDEARKAAAKHYGVSIDKIKAGSLGEHPITGEKSPVSFKYEQDGSELIVSFHPRIPADKARPTAVSRIYYGVRWTKENASALRKAALDKYGASSHPRWQIPRVWCKNPIDDAFAYCDESRKATLKLIDVGSASLELRDPSYGIALAKHNNVKKAVTPNF